VDFSFNANGSLCWVLNPIAEPGQIKRTESGRRRSETAKEAIWHPQKRTPEATPASRTWALHTP